MKKPSSHQKRNVEGNEELNIRYFCRTNLPGSKIHISQRISSSRKLQDNILTNTVSFLHSPRLSTTTTCNSQSQTSRLIRLFILTAQLHNPKFYNRTFTRIITMKSVSFSMALLKWCNNPCKEFSLWLDTLLKLFYLVRVVCRCQVGRTTTTVFLRSHRFVVEFQARCPPLKKSRDLKNGKPLGTGLRMSSILSKRNNSRI